MKFISFSCYWNQPVQLLSSSFLWDLAARCNYYTSGRIQRMCWGFGAFLQYHRIHIQWGNTQLNNRAVQALNCLLSAFFAFGFSGTSSGFIEFIRAFVTVSTGARNFDILSGKSIILMFFIGIGNVNFLDIKLNIQCIPLFQIFDLCWSMNWHHICLNWHCSFRRSGTFNYLPHEKRPDLIPRNVSNKLVPSGILKRLHDWITELSWRNRMRTIMMKIIKIRSLFTLRVIKLRACEETN